jgi:hypothetical protein
MTPIVKFLPNLFESTANAYAEKANHVIPSYECETTVHPMAAPWHLTHTDVGNVIMMSGTSLTMPSQRL